MKHLVGASVLLGTTMTAVAQTPPADLRPVYDAVMACGTIANMGLRVACFDRIVAQINAGEPITPGTPETPTPPPAPPAQTDFAPVIGDTGQWGNDLERDALTDFPNTYWFRDSNETYLGSPAAMLVVRCYRDQTDVFIRWAEYLGGGDRDNELAVMLRFDDLPAQPARWQVSTSNEAIFQPRPIAFLRQISAVTDLVVEVERRYSGRLQATFDLTGIPAVIQNVSSTCHWTP